MMDDARNELLAVTRGWLHRTERRASLRNVLRAIEMRIGVEKGENGVLEKEK
jgi:hypothetical protein